MGGAAPLAGDKNCPGATDGVGPIRADGAVVGAFAAHIAYNAQGQP